MSAPRYTTPAEVPVQPWQVQGTIYDDLVQAKYSAELIWASCANCGVMVKPFKTGWTILFWRLGVIKR